MPAALFHALQKFGHCTVLQAVGAKRAAWRAEKNYSEVEVKNMHFRLKGRNWEVRCVTQACRAGAG